MQRARIHSGGGSMPSLQAIDSTPVPSIDMQVHATVLCVSTITSRQPLINRECSRITMKCKEVPHPFLIPRIDPIVVVLVEGVALGRQVRYP